MGVFWSQGLKGSGRGVGSGCTSLVAVEYTVAHSLDIVVPIYQPLRPWTSASANLSSPSEPAVASF